MKIVQILLAKNVELLWKFERKTYLNTISEPYLNGNIQIRIRIYLFARNRENTVQKLFPYWTLKSYFHFCTNNFVILNLQIHKWSWYQRQETAKTCNSLKEYCGSCLNISSGKTKFQMYFWIAVEISHRYIINNLYFAQPTSYLVMTYSITNVTFCVIICLIYKDDSHKKYLNVWSCCIHIRIGYIHNE